MLDLPRIIGFFRRRAWLIALIGFLCIVLGAIYAFTSQPKYTAVASLLIDSSAANLSRTDPSDSPAAEDLIAIETQMQIIRSQRVALAVVDELNLTENPLFIPDQRDAITGLINEVRVAVRDGVKGIAAALGAPQGPAGIDQEAAGDAAGAAEGSTSEADEQRERAALRVRSQTQVRRMGASRAIEVTSTGNHPVLAARIANALTSAYVQDRLNSQVEATENAGAWLRERIAELQERSNETAMRVQRFREENNIVEAGGGRGLVAQEQLAAVITRLVEAANEAATERARYENIQQVIETDAWDSDLVDAGNSSLIDDLRSRYIEVVNRIATLEARLDPESPAINVAVQERERLSQAIRQELLRIAERLRTQYEVAVQREEDLRRESERLLQQTNATEEARVRLRQLESDAEVLEATYESYLRRYTEIIQQQSAPFLQARIITPALVPQAASHPSYGIILVMSAILGGGLGLAAALALDGLDRTVRLPRQLEAMGIASLGVVPLVSAAGDAPPARKLFDRLGGLASRWRRPHAAAPAGGDEKILGFVADEPASDFANSLRRTKTELHHALKGKSGAVIGVTSLSRGEGTSTIASNLGRLFAMGGRRTLLVDANLHHPTISEQDPSDDDMAPGARDFLSMRGEALVERLRNPADNDPSPAASPSDLLGSERMTALMDDARNRFDYTILDLPAIESVPDVIAAAPHLDAILIVVEWGRTPVADLRLASGMLRRHGASIAGGVINKANPGTMASLGHRPGDRGYGGSAYARKPSRQALAEAAE